VTGGTGATNDVVENLTGQQPLVMVNYVTENKALFSEAKENHVMKIGAR
jgi:hypothetical protein